MPTVIPEGFGEAAWEFSCLGDPDPWFVTIGVAFEDPFDPQDQLLAMNDTWSTNLREITNDVVTLVRSKITFNEGGTIMEAERAQNQLGNDSGAKLPQNCALLVRKSTGLAGRHFKGRNYWPGILSVEWVNEIGVIDNTTMGDLQDAFDAVYSDLNGVTNAQPALLHSDATDPTFITGFVVQNVIATQRRRLR